MMPTERLAFSSESELSGIEDSDSESNVSEIKLKVRIVYKVVNRDDRRSEVAGVQQAHSDKKRGDEALRKVSAPSQRRKRVTWFDGVRRSTNNDLIGNTSNSPDWLDKKNETKRTDTELMFVFEVNRGDLPAGSEHFRQVLQEVT